MTKTMPRLLIVLLVSLLPVARPTVHLVEWEVPPMRVTDRVLAAHPPAAARCDQGGAAPAACGRAVLADDPDSPHSSITVRVGDSIHFFWTADEDAAYLSPAAFTYAVHPTSFLDIWLHPSGTCSNVGATQVHGLSRAGELTLDYAEPGTFTYGAIDAVAEREEDMAR